MVTSSALYKKGLVFVPSFYSSRFMKLKQKKCPLTRQHAPCLKLTAELASYSINTTVLIALNYSHKAVWEIKKTMKILVVGKQRNKFLTRFARGSHCTKMIYNVQKFNKQIKSNHNPWRIGKQFYYRKGYGCEIFDCRSEIKLDIMKNEELCGRGPFKKETEQNKIPSSTLSCLLKRLTTR